jgi:hypothetical protein
MFEYPIVVPPAPNHGIRDFVFSHHIVLEQHGIRVYVTRELVEHRKQQQVVALAFDICGPCRGDQLEEQGARPLPKRANHVKLEDRIPVCSLLPFDRAVPNSDVIDLQQIGISPAALVTRVVPDLEIGLLQKQCTKGLDVLQLCLDSVRGHVHPTLRLRSPQSSYYRLT